MLVPQPPLEMSIDKSAELFITSSLSVIAALGVLYALYHWYKTGRPIVVLLFLAGGCMMLTEPMVDTVGACWFPKDSWVGFEAWGRPLPIWLCVAYFFYFGIASAVIWMNLRKGMTRGQFWGAFIASMIGDLLFESALLTVNPYTYYGHQPLWLGNGFPLWWMAVNALVPITLGVAVYRFDDYFRGWRAFAILPLGLTVSAAMNAAAGWPSWLVINTELPWVLTQLGGIATFGLSFAAINIMAAFVTSDGSRRVPAASARSAAYS